MSDATKKTDDKVEYAKMGDVGTKELLSQLEQYSAGKKDAVEKANRE